MRIKAKAFLIFLGRMIGLSIDIPTACDYFLFRSGCVQICTPYASEYQGMNELCPGSLAMEIDSKL